MIEIREAQCLGIRDEFHQLAGDERVSELPSFVIKGTPIHPDSGMMAQRRFGR